MQVSNTPTERSINRSEMPEERRGNGSPAASDNVRRMHQPLHHVELTDATWSDEAIHTPVRDAVLPAMQKKGSVVCWIVDDTGFRRF
jgi:SRSO17 transposase